jgi:low affinity Fe/Cu permease
MKLDELIRANKHARNQLIDLEDLNDKELDDIHRELVLIHEQTEKKLKHVRQRLGQVQS